MRVQHRHVVYVQGFDPRGLAQYYRMFRTELRKFDQLYQLTSAVGRPQVAADGEMGSWTIETSADDWQTRTTYDFLRWEDLMQRELAIPMWRTVLHGAWVYCRLMFEGTFAKFWQAAWRFAIFVSYSYILLLVEALLALGIAWAFENGLAALGIPGGFGIAAAAAVFVAVLAALLKYTEPWTYVLYLLSDIVWTYEFAHGRRPEWNARIDRFAAYLTEVVRGSDAEEIVIVGHSSGSFLGIEVLGRALRLDPELGRRGPRIVLLTVGANLPIAGFHAISHDFRDHLWRMAIEPSIDWIDCQARKDVMNFHLFDPIAGHGIDAGAIRRNPVIVPVRFREIIKPEHYARFRWNFFRVHFQFVMANERPHAYDFFMIVCGPVPLRERMAQPAAALAIAIGDAAARAFAWKNLEAEAAEGGIAATDPGQTERSAGRQG